MMKKISLIIFILSFLVACSNSETPLDETFWLDFNATKTITDTPLTLSFVDVNDSRCPTGLKCIWGGEVIVTLSASYEESEKTITQEIELTLNTTDKSTATIYKNYAIILSNVIPHPNTTVMSSKDDYKIEIAVKQADPLISDINWQLTHFEHVEEFATYFGDHVNFTLLLNSNNYHATGTSDCNSWSSTFNLEGEQIKFEDIMSTEMACSADSSSDSTLIQDILTNATTYSMQDDVFTLKTSNNSQFHFVDVSAKRNAFEKSYKHWKNLNIQNYSFTYHPICFGCTNTPIHIEVMDGLIVDAFYEDDFILDDVKIENLPTIDTLFDVVSSAIDMPAYSLDIAYNPTFGFPDEVDILYNQLMVDLTTRYSVSNFLPLP